jgi:hypothetical protein
MICGRRSQSIAISHAPFVSVSDSMIWFAKTLPKRKVLAIGSGEFQSAVVKGITIEQFLLADGFPHPYLGQVDNPDIYNDYGRFI